jgi:hypothetical protein
MMYLLVRLQPDDAEFPRTTNSFTTEAAPRARRGNLTHESPDTLTKMSHILS